MKPKVSLITPVYNGMPYLAEYVECVKNQTWRPLEFICVDDGSVDETYPYLESVVPELEKAGIQVILLKCPHKGQAAAVNAALSHVTGEYLTWCDADDLMHPENVEKKVWFLLEHPQIGMVRNDGIRLEEGKEDQPVVNARPEERRTKDLFDDLFREITYCYAGCYMLRTSLLWECYSDRQIPVSEEGQNLQLLLPPASRTVCGFVPDKLHVYRRRKNGHSGKKRSFTEVYTRMKNFTALRFQILEYCQCDRDYYRRLAEKIEDDCRKRLLSGAASKAREDMRDENRNSDIS